MFQVKEVTLFTLHILGHITHTSTSYGSVNKDVVVLIRYIHLYGNSLSRKTINMHKHGMVLVLRFSMVNVWLPFMKR